MSTRTAGEGLSRARKGVAVRGSGPPLAPRQNRRPGSRPWILLVFAAPSLILVLLINLYPVIYAGWQSLRDGSLIAAGDFVGFQNYSTVLHSDRLLAGRPVHPAVHRGRCLRQLGGRPRLALLLRTDIPVRGTLKVLLLLPWVVPIVVSATSINYLVATADSPMPKLFHALGLGFARSSWPIRPGPRSWSASTRSGSASPS